jgi:Xaa-Pro dipeptidase
MIDYQKRRGGIYDLMAREGIALALFEDTEGRRDPTVRWLSGHPGDALLLLTVDRKAILIPWDVNLAVLYGQADSIVPYQLFERRCFSALQGMAKRLKIPRGSKIEIPPVTPYLLFLEYVGGLTDFDIICRNSGIHGEAEKMRAVKDEEEILIYRKAAGITNGLIDLLEKNIRSGKLKTEADAALFIEAEARGQGCEGTGFTTLAAGPDRSYGIHAFPPYTAAPFAGQGLSILDFGLKYSGYTTDVTLTFVRNPSPGQEKLLALTEKAYKLALSLVEEGRPAREIARAVDVFLGKSKKTMPHGLGHGIGLQEHENPAIRGREDNEWILRPGMIFTLEPGLYDPSLGGCRLENDVLLGEAGAEVLTDARIVRL